jgi:hypothetical protein
MRRHGDAGHVQPPLHRCLQLLEELVRPRVVAGWCEDERTYCLDSRGQLYLYVRSAEQWGWVPMGSPAL